MKVTGAGKSGDSGGSCLDDQEREMLDLNAYRCHLKNAMSGESSMMHAGVFPGTIPPGNNVNMRAEIL